jgi:hypothetical protein
VKTGLKPTFDSFCATPLRPRKCQENHDGDRHRIDGVATVDGASGQASSSALASSKPKQIPALTHMRRHRCGDVDDALVRMWDQDAARMQMQAVLDTARKLPIGIRLEIFRVADDRMADMGGMNA